MAKNNHGSSVGTYILIALILGVITYVEFAIVEYPQAWLGTTMTLVVLAALSVLKFVLVVMFFMHLKDDDRMYSGFFSSGMVIALATFIALTALFILPRSMAYNESRERAERLEGQLAHGEPEAAAVVEEPAQAEAAPEAASEAGSEAAEASDWDRALGLQTYNSSCVGCHQATGQGLPGVFPPVAGHAAELYAAGGRDYLVQLVLFGVQGPIQAGGNTYNGAMPGWASFSDDQLANVLNYAVAELSEAPADFVPYTAADVASHRGDGLSPAAVHDLRDQLGLN
jgi:caa(3)-type oxidase subunit IV